MYKGHSSPHKGHVTKPKPFGASGHSNSSGGFQKSTSTGYNAKPHTEQKPSTTSSGSKSHYFNNPRTGDVCYYCKKPGHILANCHLRAKHREREQNEASVQLVSTLSSQVTEGQVSTTEVQKSPEVDPRFEGHCSLVTIVRPDLTRSDVRFHEILSAWKFQWNIAWKFHENFKKISVRRICHKRHKLKYVNCLLSIMCLCQYSYDDFPLTVHINCDWQCLCVYLPMRWRYETVFRVETYFDFQYEHLLLYSSFIPDFTC